MPILSVDDRQIEVPKGTKVIEAAERLGIMIPRFCYHEAMGSVGACRMCAVKFLQGPFKGIQMSCMIDAQDGMVVSTTDPEAVAFRRRVIEWLMMNHPHDCPVCDEGGQCLLQDETVSGGHGVRFYEGRKRTYRDQDLGIFIKHEMNRCIHCYRCSRFYQEFSGYRDLGSMQIANRVFFGRFKDGQLESPFSGNLVDICPTGVYTDRTARYKVRRWDLERSASVCPHCSLGCNTLANARYRATMRIEARFNEFVNGYFICDRGRFSFSFANGGADFEKRPWRARVEETETDPGEAMGKAIEKISSIIRDSGPEALACLGSGRCALESQAALSGLCRRMGWAPPSFFISASAGRKVRSAVSRLNDGNAVSLRRIEKADFIVAAGVDPVNEAPMLAFAMRQAFRNGAKVLVIDPRPVSLPMSFVHVPVSPGSIGDCLAALGGTGEDSSVPPEIVDFRTGLRGSMNPVVICGTDVVRESTISAAADLASSLATTPGRGGLFYVLQAANDFGAALAAGRQAASSFEDILEAIEDGVVKALIVTESDPYRFHPDRKRVENALDKLKFLVVLDYLPSGLARRADVMLPTATLFEAGMSFINQEGRVQFARPAHVEGVPQYGAHPPREFRNHVPGGGPAPAWTILEEFARGLLPEDSRPMETMERRRAGDEPIPRTQTHLPGKIYPARRMWDVIREEVASFEGMDAAGYPYDNIRALPPEGAAASSEYSRPAETGSSGDSMEIILTDLLFGTEELSAYSDAVRPMAGEPFATMHEQDAAELGISEGDGIILPLEGGPLATKVRLAANMARMAIVLPRHWKLDWQKFTTFPATVHKSDIKRV